MAWSGCSASSHGEWGGHEWGGDWSGAGWPNDSSSAAEHSHWFGAPPTPAAPPPPAAGKGGGKPWGPAGVYGKGGGKPWGPTPPPMPPHGKAGGKAAPSGEYSPDGKGGQPWCAGMTPAWASSQPAGYATGYDDGMNEGWNQGETKGWNKGWGAGYHLGLQEGFSARDAMGGGKARANSSAASDRSEQPQHKPSKNRGGNKAGTYSKWLANYMGADPPNKTFPHFQVWTEHNWSDVIEAINAELRGQSLQEGSMEIEYQGQAHVDLGEFQEVKYEYDIYIVPKAHRNQKVKEAIQAVEHQKYWKDSHDEFVPQVVGYQIKVGEPNNIRPVRVVAPEREPDGEPGDSEVDQLGGWVFQ